MTKLPQMDVPEPPAPVDPPPPPAPAKPGKLRTYISVGVLVAILAVVLYATRNNQQADDLKVGTCFDSPTAGQEFSTVETHPCTEAHDAEVILVVEYTGGDSYPITLTMESFVESTCVPAFETYVGEPFPGTTYALEYIHPNSDGWASGDRTFTCYVVDANDAKLTKSAKVGAAPAAS